VVEVDFLNFQEKILRIYEYIELTTVTKMVHTRRSQLPKKDEL